MRCTYCDRPLLCESCGEEFEPKDQEQYDALSRPDVAILCPKCEEVLVCHWCKTAYDGESDEDRGDVPG